MTGSAAVFAASLILAAPTWRAQEGTVLIGNVAPEWQGIDWIQGGPLSLSSLRGKVVLLRFWLVACPFCTATAPALRELQRRHADEGLVVVGLHHPKSEEARDPALVARAARALAFDFPIGLDQEWRTIRRYGVGTIFRRYTSVTFLIDRKGAIRWVHDGGEFHAGGGAGHEECNAAYESLVATVKQSLAEGD